VDKTLVKYRSVEIGIVKEISFNESHEQIIVTLEIEREMERLLKPDTLFWVVKPRVGAGGISGIGTLLSGAYLELSAGIEDGLKTEFIGLESPPVTPQNAPGVHLTLTSIGGKPIEVGSPVVHRGFKVGKVESFEYDTQERVISYGVFIAAPYDSLVTDNTIFWNAGGLSVTANAEGIKVDMAGLESLLIGGVEFDVLENQPLGARAENGQQFALYDSRDGIEKNRVYKFYEYLVLVDDSVGGLYAGAPVEYQGIRIGTVEKPYLKLDAHLEGIENIQADPRIPVLVHIEPGRVFENPNADLQGFISEIEGGMLIGLAAAIESANLLTGSLKVTLKYGSDPISEIERYGPYKVIPTRRAGVAAITDQVQNLLAILNSLPLDQTVDQANTAIGTANSTLATLEGTLKEFEKTLQGIQPSSAAYESLNASVEELRIMLKNLQPVIQDISNRPNSVIFGKPVIADEEPQVRK
ncbi:MAG: MlaD family protein, partial [Pseudomonadota bacterium]